MRSDEPGERLHRTECCLRFVSPLPGGHWEERGVGLMLRKCGYHPRSVGLNMRVPTQRRGATLSLRLDAEKGGTTWSNASRGSMWSQGGENAGRKEPARIQVGCAYFPTRLMQATIRVRPQRTLPRLQIPRPRHLPTLPQGFPFRLPRQIRFPRGRGGM